MAGEQFLTTHYRGFSGQSARFPFPSKVIQIEHFGGRERVRIFSRWFSGRVTLPMKMGSSALAFELHEAPHGGHADDLDDARSERDDPCFIRPFAPSFAIVRQLAGIGGHDRGGV
jgi:hypothetical protein